MFDYNDIPADLREMMDKDGTNVLVISKPVGENIPVCQKCNATMRTLNRMNIDYSVSKTIDQDEHREFVINKIGGNAAPAVVVVDDDNNVVNAWSDFRMDTIRSIKQSALAAV